MEKDALSSVLTIISRKISACVISSSYNHIKEEQMLLLDVGFQHFANVTKQILEFSILKAKEYYSEKFNKGTFAYAFKKIIIVLIAKKIRDSFF